MRREEGGGSETGVRGMKTNTVLCWGDRQKGEMSEHTPGGGAVHLRACSALPGCISWSRKAVIFLSSLVSLSLSLQWKRKKKKKQQWSWEYNMVKVGVGWTLGTKERGFLELPFCLSKAWCQEQVLFSAEHPGLDAGSWLQDEKSLQWPKYALAPLQPLVNRRRRCSWSY